MSYICSIPSLGRRRLWGKHNTLSEARGQPWTHSWSKVFFFDEFSLCRNLSSKFTQYNVRRQTPYVSLWTGQIASREDRKSIFSPSQNSSFKCYDSDLGSLVVSLSNGGLCLLNPFEGSNMGVAETWHAHDYEPWIAAWNYWDPNVIYSGH